MAAAFLTLLLCLVAMAEEEKELGIQALPVLVIETGTASKVVIHVSSTQSGSPKKDRLKMLEEAKAKLEAALRAARKERE